MRMLLVIGAVLGILVASTEPAAAEASSKRRGNEPPLSPNAKATVRSLVGAHLSAPRGEEAARHLALQAELMRGQDLLRATLQAVAAGAEETQVLLARAECDRLVDTMIATRGRVRLQAREHEELERVELRLSELASELEAISRMPDGAPRRARAAALAARLAPAGDAAQDAAPPMKVYPGFAPPPGTAP